MIGLVAALVVALSAAALGATPLTAQVAGLRSRAPLAPRPATSPWAIDTDLLRLGCAAAALVLVSGPEGDVLIGAALAASAVAVPGPSAGVLVCGIVAALRVGSTSMAHVAGAASVLGAAVRSPRGGVALAAGLGALAAMAAAAAVLPARPRGGWRGQARNARAAADAVAPVAALSVGLVAAAGPLVVRAAPVGAWVAVHLGALAGGLVAAGLLRRLAGRLPAPVPTALPALLGAGALVVALAA